MDFENVFTFLRELFPESRVDDRILRAVALKYSNNVDEAVHYVVKEVIPRLHDGIDLSSASLDRRAVVSASDIEERSVENEDSDTESSDSDTESSESDTESSESDTESSESDTESDTTDSETSQDISVEHQDSALNLSVNSVIASVDYEQEDSSEVGLNHVAPRRSNDSAHELICQVVNSINEDIKRYRTLTDGVDGSSSDCHSHVTRDSNLSLVQELYDVNTSSVQSDIHPDSESDYEKSNANGTSSLGFEQECNIDLLDEIIDDAREYKITLFSTMKSVINEMKELEHKEKYVEKVKEEAANGELEILVKAEERKQSVARFKQAIDMRAGEVYGEKAILATETRELQSRLLGLSNQRDESLSILDEMLTTLKARMAAVDAKLKVAEEEKLAKEEQARKALAEQEALFERLVQESTIQRQEAEENSKLREFLVHHGPLVDMLKAELSVICEDVSLLKEKFDLEVPLSKFFSSNQTSCILASSGDEARFCLPLKFMVPSNLDAKKGTASDLRIEGSRAPSVSSSSLFFDNGWEVFDKDAELAEDL